MGRVPRTSTHALPAVVAALTLALAGCSTGGDDTSQEAAAGGGAPAGVARADAASHGTAPVPGITVEGSARITGHPDTLTATVGVEVERPTVQEALDAGNAGAQRVIDAVREAGVAEEDVQTAQFQVHPRYEQQPSDEPVIRGYLVSNLLEIRVRDVDRAGEVLAAATEAGDQDARVQGIRFSLEDNDALVAQARDQAFADARARAEDYARLAGRELGAVVSIDETFTPAVPSEQFAGEAAALDEARAGAPVPVRPGQQEVEVRVTTVWSLG